MSRPLRIEFEGAVYHVTSRGDRREPIFVDDGDREALLRVVAHGMDRFSAQLLSYCLMGNHCHFVLHTREANLSRLMRHVKGVYTQAFNRRHGKVGHLFRGRFKAILVDRDAYLLKVCRDVELNPVRAGMVPEPRAWPWSSYRAHAGLGVTLWTQALNKQIYLGDDEFVARMQALADKPSLRDRAVPKAQRSRSRTLHQWLKACTTREEALRTAYVHSGLSMTAMAADLGLTVARVSQLITRAEAERGQPSDQ